MEVGGLDGVLVQAALAGPPLPAEEADPGLGAEHPGHRQRAAVGGQALVGDGVEALPQGGLAVGDGVPEDLSDVVAVDVVEDLLAEVRQDDLATVGDRLEDAVVEVPQGADDVPAGAGDLAGQDGSGWEGVALPGPAEELLDGGLVAAVLVEGAAGVVLGDGVDLGAAVRPDGGGDEVVPQGPAGKGVDHGAHLVGGEGDQVDDDLGADVGDGAGEAGLGAVQEEALRGVPGRVVLVGPGGAAGDGGDLVAGLGELGDEVGANVPGGPDDDCLHDCGPFSTHRLLEDRVVLLHEELRG